MNKWRVLLTGLIASALGYGIYRGTRPYFSKTLKAPPVGGDPGAMSPTEQYARMQAADRKTSVGPWYVSSLAVPENGAREATKRYMARTTSPSDDGEAIVEGIWKGDTTTNRLGGVLRVDRIVSGKLVPVVPFDLAIPASKNALFNDYVEETRWRPLHASSVGETAYEGKAPKVGTKVSYALREGNPLGNLVVVLTGRVLDPTSSYWPKDEGEPDSDRVLVSADDIVRTVRGEGGDVRMPPAYVIPVEDLIGLEKVS